MLSRRSQPSTATLCLLLGIVVLTPGCVRRRLMVRSNPPGAMVYVDNQPIGSTPCATSFIYYGTREIRLVKPGYETLTVNQPIPAPWYQLPPIDFVSENVVPREIQDYRTVSYNMIPQVIVPTEQLINRGEELRRSTQQGAAMPPTTDGIPQTFPLLNPPQPTPALDQFPAENVPPGIIAPGIIAPPAPAGTIPQGGQPLEALPSP